MKKFLKKKLESEGITQHSEEEIQDQNNTIKRILDGAENGLYKLEKYTSGSREEHPRIRIKDESGKILYDFPESEFYTHAGELYARVEEAFKSKNEGHA